MQVFHASVSLEGHEVHGSDEKALAFFGDIRLDNGKELIRRLALDSDLSWNAVDLIMESYRKWGVSCPAFLLGDFAFAIWDREKNVVFCARDYLGIKPFYYNDEAANFTFANDESALLGRGVSTELDLAYTCAHFRNFLRFPHPTRGFYKGIKKLAPGHVLVASAEGTQSWAWWAPTADSSLAGAKIDEWAEQLLVLMQESVRCRVSAHDKVGVHYSGGLDCTGISAMAKKLEAEQGGTTCLFSWSPPLGLGAASVGEQGRIADLARREGSQVYYCQPTAVDHCYLRLADPVRLKDAPFVTELSVRRQAQEAGVSLLLSGWGGDQFLTGEGLGYLAELFLKGRWLLLSRELTEYSQISQRNPLRVFTSRVLKPLLPDALHDLVRKRYGRCALPTLFKTSFFDLLSHHDGELHMAAHRERPGLRRMQLRMLDEGQITHRIEQWAAAGYRSGISYSYPMLDQRIVNFALSLPGQAFFSRGQIRYLYRYAMTKAGILPEPLAWSNKWKSEPNLNADRRLVADSGRPLMARVLQTAVVSSDVFEVLDRGATLKSLDLSLQDEDPSHGHLGNAVGSVHVEQLVNPKLHRLLLEIMEVEHQER